MINVKRILLMISILLALNFLFGCNQNKFSFNIEQMTLSPVKKIPQINDSIFLSLVSDMFDYQGYIYMSDLKNNRIVCIDSTYKFSHIIGSPGNGPAEFNFPNGCVVDNNKLYAIDEGHKRINIYKPNGEFIGNIKGLVPHSGRFIVEDSIYYGSPMGDDSGPPIFKATIDGRVLKRFGTNTRLMNNINKDAFRKFFLERWNEQIIAICENDPVIERYSLNGNFIGMLDLSKIKYFNNLFPYFENMQKKERKDLGFAGIISLVLKTYLENNRLFLLMGGYDKSTDKQTCNHILILEIGKEDITPIKILKLNGGTSNDSWYYSFCVVDNKIIAYDAFTYEIHEFEINL